MTVRLMKHSMTQWLVPTIVAATVICGVAKATQFDFNNDGNQDLIFQSSQNLGVLGQALAANGSKQGGLINLIAGTERVQLVGVYDMNGDGISDFVVRPLLGDSVHRVVLRNASGAVTATRAYDPGAANWRIVGVFDQNKDSNTDLIWQNSTTGQVVIWYLNASGVRIDTVVLVKSMADFRIVGVGDMNGDGHMDLLWQKVTGTTTQIVAWYLNAAGQRLSSGGTKVIDSVTGGYRCLGLGDYNGDGVLDILWQQVDNQQIVLWRMNASGGRIGNAVVLSAGGVGQYIAHWQWEFSVQVPCTTMKTVMAGRISFGRTVALAKW
jgi:hypothetical protein